jgi:hypothetical protein
MDGCSEKRKHQAIAELMIDKGLSIIRQAERREIESSFSSEEKEMFDQREAERVITR